MEKLTITKLIIFENEMLSWFDSVAGMLLVPHSSTPFLIEWPYVQAHQQQQLQLDWFALSFVSNRICVV